MVIKMKKRLLDAWLFVAIFFCSSIASLAQAQDFIDLSVSKTQAVATALGRFVRDGYKPEGYRMTIRSNMSGIEVVFVPPLEKSASTWGAMQRSSQPEVHYYLDVSGEKVLRRLDGQ